MSQLGQTLALPARPRSWTPQGWVLAFAAMLVLGAVLVNYRPVASTQPVPSTANLNTTPTDGDDQQLLRHVSRQEPDVRTAYENSLKEVNAYITDAKKAADDNPDDAAAQEYLVDAYQQKAMLYEMATVRSQQ